MAVRNFYIEADIDGKRHPLRGGPQAKEGGFDLIISQREEGEIIEVVEILGRVGADGLLRLTVNPGKDNEVRPFGGRYVTQR